MISRYLEHVLQDIEAKTPQLAKQQQEYQEMVAGQQRLAKLYASVSTLVHSIVLILREVTALKHELEVAKKEAQKQKKRAETLEQIMNNLEQKGEENTEKELRLSTQKLVDRIAELEANQSKSGNSQEKERIEALETELDALRRAQKEEEHMNTVITKQRDMYKELLAERDAIVLEQNKPEQSFQATHAQLLQHAKETVLQLQTVRSSLQEKVDSLHRQLMDKRAGAKECSPGS